MTATRWPRNSVGFTGGWRVLDTEPTRGEAWQPHGACSDFTDSRDSYEDELLELGDDAAGALGDENDGHAFDRADAIAWRCRR